MRTFSEFQEEFKKAHDCEKCHDKMIAITMDLFGNASCAYCHEKVKYPTATKEELLSWIKIGLGEERC